MTAVLLSGWLVYRGCRAKDRAGVMLLVRDGVGGIILLNATLLMSADQILYGILMGALIIPVALCLSSFKRHS